MRSVRDLTQQLTTRADDNHAPFVSAFPKVPLSFKRIKYKWMILEKSSISHKKWSCTIFSTTYVFRMSCYKQIRRCTIQKRMKQILKMYLPTRSSKTICDDGSKYDYLDIDLDLDPNLLCGLDIEEYNKPIMWDKHSIPLKIFSKFHVIAFKKFYWCNLLRQIEGRHISFLSYSIFFESHYPYNLKWTNG